MDLGAGVGKMKHISFLHDKVILVPENALKMH